jgi:cytochrome c oxidase subunit 2
MFTLIETGFYFLVTFGAVSLFSAESLKADAAIPYQYGIQDPATPIAEGIIAFHHDLMFILIFVVIFVSWMLGRAVQHFSHENNPTPDGVVHGTTIEIVWTIVPALILMVIAVPSFALLYSVDEVVEPALTLKIVGHQWYWSYEYSDYVTDEDGEALAFDSYMLPSDELRPGDLRLLEVDNRIVLPTDTHIRLVVTAADVLHCWTIPSFGVKMDACPGRLNQASLFVQRQGVFYGQCSEICGINHGFMPIAVETVPMKEYLTWVYTKLSEELYLRTP